MRKQARTQKSRSNSFNLKLIQPTEQGEGRVLSSPTDEVLSPISQQLLKPFQFNSQMPGEFNSTKYDLESNIVATDSPCEGHTELILASASTNRRAILKQLKWSHQLMSPDIDEKSIRTDDHLDLPVTIAIAKAAAVMSKLREARHPNRCIVITSDQVVLFQGSVREKPESREEAVRFLSSYSSNSVRTVSGVVVTEYPSGTQRSATDVASVHWGVISDHVVQKVVDKGEIFSSAGGFRIDDEDLSPLIHQTEGGVDSILGLPVALTKSLIEVVLALSGKPSSATQACTNGEGVEMDYDDRLSEGATRHSNGGSSNNGSNNGSNRLKRTVSMDSHGSHDSITSELVN
jgi:septum formation protein